LKKQSQFLKGQNERKINYKKELWPIFAIGHLVKTNPIKANLGIMKRFDVKKTEFALPGQTFYVGPAA
jgi:hypothetical protein